MTSVNENAKQEFDDVVIRIEDAFTYGLSKSKFGFELPLRLEPEHVTIIENEATKRGADGQLFGRKRNLLYLHCDQINPEHQTDLLDAGRMIVDIEFAITGSYTRRDKTTNLRCEILGLSKVGVPERILKSAPRNLVLPSLPEDY